MSALAREFEAYWQTLAGPDAPAFTTEYRFHPKRRWKFDFAWPGHKVAVEMEGIISSKSRHTTLTGYTGDCHKYNRAAIGGWTVLRFTRLDMDDPARVVDEVLETLAVADGVTPKTAWVMMARYDEDEPDTIHWVGSEQHWPTVAEEEAADYFSDVPTLVYARKQGEGMLMKFEGKGHNGDYRALWMAAHPMPYDRPISSSAIGRMLDKAR